MKPSQGLYISQGTTFLYCDACEEQKHCRKENEVPEAQVYPVELPSFSLADTNPRTTTRLAPTQMLRKTPHFVLGET